MIFDYFELNEMAKTVDKIISPEERKAMNLDPPDDSALRSRAKGLVEADLAQSMTLQPIDKIKSADKRTLYPWYGKESDSEVAFNFESVMDAQELYDFVVNTGLLEPGEIKMHISEHQVSVHFMPHVLVMKPEIFQAALLAYESFVEDTSENYAAFEALVEEVDRLLAERTKVSGAPKGRGKGNPFHDKNDGKFSGPDAIAGEKGGSFISGKTKLKYAGDKKSKKGDKVVNFASTKRPCGRKARGKGKDVRCWDGKKGKGFREGINLANVMTKRMFNREITDDDLRGMVEALNYVEEMSRLTMEAYVEEGKNVVWFRKQAEKMHKEGVSDKKILAALIKLGATKDQADFYLSRATLQR